MIELFAHKSFNCICQEVPVCTPSNILFYRTHESLFPNDIMISSAVFE